MNKVNRYEEAVRSSFTLTKEEQALFKQFAAESCRSLSAFIRFCVHKEIKARKQRASEQVT